MNKKAFLPALFCCALLACNTNGPKGTPVEDTPVEQAAILPAGTDSATVSPKALQATGDSILESLEHPDTHLPGKWIHPKWKLHFSPYGFIDTAEGQTLDGPHLQTLLAQGTKLYWGLYDGSGDSIHLSTGDYLEKFVLDKDFRNAPAVAVDSILGRGNTLVNTLKIYPNAHVVEYHFPGTEKYGLMDWKSLRLVLQMQQGRLWLVCIAHDEWTI